MRTGVIVSARTGSQRLPGKALLPFLGLPSVIFLLRRLAGASRVDSIMLATTTLDQDDALAAIVAAEGVPVFRGHPTDLIDRYVAAATWAGIDRVVRVTGDCPFVDAATLNHCLDACDAAGDFDLATTKGAFPVGIDYEIYPAERMRALHARTDLTDAHREHLTLYFYDHGEAMTIKRLSPQPEWWSDRIFTLDTQDDYQRMVGWTQTLNRVDSPVSDVVAVARSS